MSVFSKLESLKSAIRAGVLSRILAVLLGGSLNQKVIVVLGLAVIAGSMYYLLIHLWQPLIVGVVGCLFVHLALKDYERSSGQ